MLELLKVTENRYSGIPTIRREFRNADLPDPVFEDVRGVFRVIFRNGIGIQEDEIDKSDIRRAVVQYCSAPRTREELTRFTEKSRYYTMSAIVQPLLDQGKLRMTMPDKPKSPKQQYAAADERPGDSR